METGKNIILELISSDEPYTGTVTSSRPIETGGFVGIETEIDIPGYGKTTVLINGGNVTDQQAEFTRLRSGIPQRFIKSRWSDFKWSYYGGREALARPFKIAQSFIARNDYFRENNKGLYILGKASGSGKTMLACVLANEIMAKYSCSVKFIDQERYLSLLRSDEKSARDEIKAIWNCSILFLDGFGNCSTQFQREQLLKLIEIRQKIGCSTCYVSCLSPNKVFLDESCKANDLINSNSIGVRLPEVQIRAMIAAQDNKEFELNLFSAPSQMTLEFPEP